MGNSASKPSYCTEISTKDWDYALHYHNCHNTYTYKLYHTLCSDMITFSITIKYFLLLYNIKALTDVSNKPAGNELSLMTW